MSAIAEPNFPRPTWSATTAPSGPRLGRSRAAGRFFDRRGRRVSRSAWQRLGDFPGYTLVALETLRVGEGLVQVHTFWLGIADPRHPLIFRTVTSGTRPQNATWGWPTDEAARAGHRAVCAWAVGRAPLPAGLLAVVEPRGAAVGE
jgi:hypothetical protein